MISPRFTSGCFAKADFLAAIEEHGYAIVENVMDADFCTKIIPELESAVAREAEFHGTTSYKDYGTLLACPIYGGRFLEVADNQLLMEPFCWILGDTCIIYVYTSSSMPPHQSNYTERIHVDRPHFIPDYIEALGGLVLLNDFTEENGATWILPGSHKTQEEPGKDYFFKNAIRLIAPRGSVFYFNLRLWHAGGANTTDTWRHLLGLGMVRGYLKQRIDLPKALSGIDISGVSDSGLQKLGFFAQPPASLEEYYTPQAERKYRQRSEWEPVEEPK